MLSQTDNGGEIRTEVNVEKMFCLGVALGMVGGALLVANSYKARSLVKKSQAEVIEKVNEMMDEKLNAAKSEGEQSTGAKSEKKKS